MALIIIKRCSCQLMSLSRRFCIVSWSVIWWQMIGNYVAFLYSVLKCYMMTDDWELCSISVYVLKCCMMTDDWELCSSCWNIPSLKRKIKHRNVTTHFGSMNHCSLTLQHDTAECKLQNNSTSSIRLPPAVSGWFLSPPRNVTSSLLTTYSQYVIIKKSDRK
jgi:hypothetical protein